MTVREWQRVVGVGKDESSIIFIVRESLRESMNQYDTHNRALSVSVIT
jgi:hypothetical protein